MDLKRLADVARAQAPLLAEADARAQAGALEAARVRAEAEALEAARAKAMAWVHAQAHAALNPTINPDLVLLLQRLDALASRLDGVLSWQDAQTSRLDRLIAQADDYIKIYVDVNTRRR